MRPNKRVLILLAVVAFLPWWWWGTPDTGPPVAAAPAAPIADATPTPHRPIVPAIATTPTAASSSPTAPDESEPEPEPMLGIVRGHVTVLAPTERRAVVYASGPTGTHAIATDAQGGWGMRLAEGHWTFHAEVGGGEGLYSSRREELGVAAGQERYLALEVATGEAASAPGLDLADLFDGYLVEDLDARAEEAGLEVGDIVLAVEGQPTGELRPHQLRAALRGPAGSSVLLTVLRGDDEVPVAIPLAED